MFNYLIVIITIIIINYFKNFYSKYSNFVLSQIFINCFSSNFEIVFFENYFSNFY